MKLFGKSVIDGVKYLEIFGRRFRYGEEATLTEVLAELRELRRLVNDEVKDKLFEREESIVWRVNSAKRYADIYRCAAIEHQKVFPKYRNCNVGKDLVLLASGPTLDYYDLHQDAKYIGVNKVIYSNKAALDYLFVQDLIPDAQDDLDAYKGNDCRKFYGVHYMVPPITQFHADRAGAERYYFINWNQVGTWDYPPDISMLPFTTYGTVVHPAVTFALYTGPRRLYLVGCDTSHGGHPKNLDYKESWKNDLPVDGLLLGWRKLKTFAEQFYPQTEIVSVNPVGLKGLFRDVYTENYLRDHREISNVSVLTV